MRLAGLIMIGNVLIYVLIEVLPALLQGVPRSTADLTLNPIRIGLYALDLLFGVGPVSYTHLTLPTTPYV
jgi:hypothetical protein